MYPTTPFAAQALSSTSHLADGLVRLLRRVDADLALMSSIIDWAAREIVREADDAPSQQGFFLHRWEEAPVISASTWPARTHPAQCSRPAGDPVCHLSLFEARSPLSSQTTTGLSCRALIGRGRARVAPCCHERCDLALADGTKRHGVPKTRFAHLNSNCGCSADGDAETRLFWCWQVPAVAWPELCLGCPPITLPMARHMFWVRGSRRRSIGKRWEGQKAEGRERREEHSKTMVISAPSRFSQWDAQPWLSSSTGRSASREMEGALGNTSTPPPPQLP